MGIGFILLIWLIFFAAIVTVFFILNQLSENFDVIKASKDVLIAFGFVIFLTLGIILILGSTNYALDNYYPSRVFKKHFGFAPTTDVQNLESSSKLFTSNGLGETTLTFEANKNTVQRIIYDKVFVEKFKESFKDYKDEKLSAILKSENSHIYISSHYSESCDESFSSCLAILAFNENSGEVYFKW